MDRKEGADMQINTDTIVLVAEANRNFANVTRVVEKHGKAVIVDNNKAKYLVIDLEKNPVLDLTDDEKIDIVAARVMHRFRPAFEELAK